MLLKYVLLVGERMGWDFNFRFMFDGFDVYSEKKKER